MPFMVQHVVKPASHSQCHVTTFTPASEPPLSCSLPLGHPGSPLPCKPCSSTMAWLHFQLSHGNSFCEFVFTVSSRELWELLYQAVCILSHLIFNTLILELRKLRLKEVKCLVQNHTPGNVAKLGWASGPQSMYFLLPPGPTVHNPLFIRYQAPHGPSRSHERSIFQTPKALMKNTLTPQGDHRHLCTLPGPISHTETIMGLGTGISQSLP